MPSFFTPANVIRVGLIRLPSGLIVPITPTDTILIGSTEWTESDAAIAIVERSLYLSNADKSRISKIHQHDVLEIHVPNGSGFSLLVDDAPVFMGDILGASVRLSNSVGASALTSLRFRVLEGLAAVTSDGKVSMCLVADVGVPYAGIELNNPESTGDQNTIGVFLTIAGFSGMIAEFGKDYHDFKNIPLRNVGTPVEFTDAAQFGQLDAKVTISGMDGNDRPQVELSDALNGSFADFQPINRNILEANKYRILSPVSIADDASNPYTPAAGEEVILVNNSAPFTLNLSADISTEGRKLTVKKISAGADLVSVVGTDVQIDSFDAYSYELSVQNQFVTLVCADSNWWVIAQGNGAT